MNLPDDVAGLTPPCLLIRSLNLFSSKLQVAWARGRKSLSGWRSRGGVLLSPVAQLLVYAALVGIAMSCLAVIARNRRASGHSKARTM